MRAERDRGHRLAIRSWLRDDPQEAVWAGQVYEAADYGAQRRNPATGRAYSA